MKTFITTFLLAFLFFTIKAQPYIELSSLRNEETTFHNNESLCNRDQVIQDYELYYNGSYVNTSELGWTGDVEACSEGTISHYAFEQTLARINYFRRLVGVQNEIIFSEAKNAKCQKAVLMMDAENKLDHYPTADWKCSSPEGIEAAGKSNLSYGGHSSAAITQYIRDAGSGNGAVGHRRWILYPKAYEFGFGSTNWGTALWVIGGNQTPDSIPDFVAYPSPGYFPKSLIYPRWSFSKKGAKYTKATVKMQDENGSNIELYLEEVANGYGDNSLVWVPATNLYDNTNGTDHFFEVTIDSVQIGSEYKTYKYSVLGIDPETSEISGSILSPNCNEANGSISLNLLYGYKDIIWSNGAENTLEISGLNPGNYSATIIDKLGCEQEMFFKLNDSNPPKILDQIMGNLVSTIGQIEVYQTTEFEEGDYNWEVENGNIVSGEGLSKIEVKWDDNLNSGKICVQFIGISGCKSNEICVDVDLMTSGIVNSLSSQNIKIFPNPALDQVNIQLLNNANILNVSLFDSSGNEIIRSEENKNSERMIINTQNLSPGIYFLKIQSKEEFSVEKIIKM